MNEFAKKAALDIEGFLCLDEIIKTERDTVVAIIDAAIGEARKGWLSEHAAASLITAAVEGREYGLAKSGEKLVNAFKLIDMQRAEIERLREAYNELIMAVARKFPDETRHQTALRYIQTAEQRAYGSGTQQALEEKKGGEA